MRRRILVAIVVVALAWVAPVRAAPPGRDQRQEQNVHTVQPGENLFRIALRYGTTIDALMAANGLTDARTIVVGQRLVIPRGANSSAAAEPAAATGQAAVAEPADTGGSYTVKRGDTLTRIAARHGVTVDALMRANGLAGGQYIHAGQRLTIPGAASAAAASSPVKEAPGATATSDTHIVGAGESLGEIAARFDTTVTALARLNGIANPSAIYTGQVLRLSESAPVPPPGGTKRIVIDLSEQHLYAYQGERLVYSFVASSGAAPSYTRVGEFRVQSKIPKAYGATWNIWMPHWLGIYWAGSTENGIHALPILSNGQTLWAGYLGRPVSYGCIVLGTYEAQQLYNWAEIGTPVSIKY
jgi:LysM repeat protein